jgi:O-antigen chain-terminating methyltransferase
MDPSPPPTVEEGGERRTASLAELLLNDGESFVVAAHLTALGRPPREAELSTQRSALEQGELSKVELLGRLRYCREGRARGQTIRGLLLPYVTARLCRVPLLGYLLTLAIAVLGLPRTLRQQRITQARLAGQTRALAGQLQALLEELGHHIPRLADHVAAMPSQADLEALREATARQAAVDQLAGRCAALEERLATAPEHADAGRAAVATPALSPERPTLDAMYLEFENRFRGDRSEISRRLEAYLGDVLEAVGRCPGGSLLDLGCGRGEWLELLARHDLSAVGVDSNRELVRRCRELGLAVDEADALGHLCSLPERTCSVVSAFHLIEHLDFVTVIALLDQIWRVLKPGGIVILETPNPENLIVGACTFHADPSHRRPLVPDTLQFFVEQRGFSEVCVRRLNSYAELYGIARGDGVAGQWLHNEMDFAVIGVRR